MNQDFLNDLANIEKVDPPAHLYARIQERIERETKQQVSLRTTLLTLLLFFVIVAANLFSLAQHRGVKTGEHQLLRTLQLMPDNQLYP